jgi:signal transduction histidine kinase
VEQIAIPFVRMASVGLTWGRVRSPRWVQRALRPQGLVSTGEEAAWAAVLALLCAGLVLLDLRSPVAQSTGALIVLPVLGAAWMLSSRLFLAVLALAVTLEVAASALGYVHPLMGAARLTTLLVVATAGRVGALSWAAARSARQHEVSSLLRTSEVLGRTLGQESVAAEAVRLAAGTLAVPGSTSLRHAVLFRVAGERTTVLAAYDVAGTPAALSAGLPLRLMPAVFHETLLGGRPRVAEVRDLAPILGDLASAHGTASWALARVEVAGVPFGVLAVASRDPSGLPSDDLRLLDGIAGVAALAIEASLRHAEVTQLQQRLQDSVQLALEVGRTLDPGEVIGSILVRATESVRADQAALARVDGRDLIVESAYWSAAPGRLVRVRRHFRSDSVAAIPCVAQALAAGQPVASGPLTVRMGGEELSATLPACSHTLSFPFVVSGQAACLLVLGRAEGGFDERDLRHLEPMADVALLALRNAQLYAQAEQAKRTASTYSGRLQQAIEAAADIGSGNELSDVLERVLRRAASVVRADRGNISRIDGDTMVMERNYDPDGAVVVSGTHWALAMSPIAAEAIRERSALRGDLRKGDDQMTKWAREVGVKHVIQCPLVVEREVVGLLGLSRRRDEEFTEADLLALQPLATLAGLLLRNARLLAEAREVGEAKAAFLNLAAHELRTPLAVIRGYLSMLEDGTYPVPDRTRDEAVNTLVAKAQELESLVEALLTSARLEAGALPRSSDEFDVREAVRQAVARIRPRARLEGARIDLKLPEEALPTGADREHVARVLDNLLNNALTYSGRPAHVKVEVRTRSPIEIAVEDHGHGIPPEQHDLVFERFHRVEDESSSFSPGLGLGLSISRELAQVNGGSLLLERSEPGQGSVFVLRLPPVESAERVVAC